jgi:hypothetical protein
VPNTVPTTPTGAEGCELDWCQQPAGHAPENHVHLVGVVEPTPFDNHTQAVLVTVEAGHDEVDPLPVVTLVGDGETSRRPVRLDWREAVHLARALIRAVEDHAPAAVLARGVGTIPEDRP